VEAWSAEEGGYAHLHSTKPLTLGTALEDSPAGMAAWIGEKYRAWSSPTPQLQEHLLATLTLYWATRTATTSLLPYFAHRHENVPPMRADNPPPTPTAIDIFGGEVVPFPKPPRELAERYFNVVHWEEHERGGHFPAVAEPDLLAQQLRRAFGSVRAG
jgi:hypothetical protein